MSKFVSFNPIEQYYNCARGLKMWAKSNDSIVEPFNITGTVKVHGTNMGIAYWADGSITWQTRNRVVSSDNSDGFNMKQFITNLGLDTITDMLKPLLGDFQAVIVYGEFFGKGIQKNVAVAQLDKSFMAFDLVKVKGKVKGTEEDDGWHKEHLSLNLINSYPERNFYRSIDFKQFHRKIDIYSETTYPDLIDLTVREVEMDCPVASQIQSQSQSQFQSRSQSQKTEGDMVMTLSPKTECTTGEGIVWQGEAKLHNGQSRIVMFKTKGDKHQRAQGSAKTSGVKSFTPEQNDALARFYEVALTGDRLEQGFEQFTGELTVKQISPYIKWVINDIQKEHADDIEDILANAGLTWKHVNKEIVNTIRQYFFTKLAQ